MAKKIKQPSKIAKLTAEFKSSSQSQDDINASVEQRIRDLEEIGLSLATAMKGITSHLISTNVGNVPNLATKFKNENNIEENQSSILQKMYNFMVSSAEKREKRNQLFKAKKREERKQKLIRMKKSFKMAVRQKITPTTGGVLKTMGFGLIGASVAGLAWIFQDEIKNYANSIKDSVLGFKTFIIEKFKIISGFLRYLKDVFQPIINFIGQKAETFAQSTMKIDTSQGVYEGVKKWVTDFVFDFVGKVTDKITGWLYDIGKSISQWLVKPLSMEDYGKLMATIATRLIAGPWAAGGVALTGPISSGVTGIKTYFNKAEYGEDFVNKVREIVDLNPDYRKLDNQSKQDIINNIIEQIQTGQAPTDLLGITKVGKKEVFGQSAGMVMSDVYPERKKKQEDLYRSLVQGKYDAKKSKMAVYGYQYIGSDNPDMPTAGYFINGSGDRVSMQEVDKKLIQLSLRQDVGQLIKEQTDKFTDNTIKPIVQPVIDTIQNVSGEYKKLKDRLDEVNKTYKIGETISETATKSVETAQETVRDVGDAYKEETDNVTSPTDALIAGFSLGERGIEKTIQTTASLASKGMENLKPTLEKLSNIDYQQEAIKSYSALQNVWGKVSETAQTLSNPEKFGEFIDKLQGGEQTPNQISALVPANTPTIQPDPNENLLLNELMSQVNNAIVNNNSIINNRSSSEDVYSESPRIRDNNTSIQRSSLQNTSPWDIPFSFAR